LSRRQEELLKRCQRIMDLLSEYLILQSYELIEPLERQVEELRSRLKLRYTPPRRRWSRRERRDMK